MDNSLSMMAVRRESTGGILLFCTRIIFRFFFCSSFLFGLFGIDSLFYHHAFSQILGLDVCLLSPRHGLCVR